MKQFSTQRIGILAAALVTLAAGGTSAQAAPVTVTGRLLRDADNKAFFMRDTYGREYKVDTSRFIGAESANKLLEGNTVRVHGNLINNVIYAGNVRFLGSRYVKKGTRLSTSNYHVRSGSKATLVGTLVNDADDDAFEIRDTRGRMHKVFTRSIPDAYGANKLQEGQLVRVHGRWAADENGWAYLEAANFRVLTNYRIGR